MSPTCPVLIGVDRELLTAKRAFNEAAFVRFDSLRWSVVGEKGLGIFKGTYTMAFLACEIAFRWVIRTIETLTIAFPTWTSHEGVVIVFVIEELRCESTNILFLLQATWSKRLPVWA